MLEANTFREKFHKIVNSIGMQQKYAYKFGLNKQLLYNYQISFEWCGSISVNT